MLVSLCLIIQKVTTCVGAWQYLLKQPLKEAEVPVTGQQKDVLLNTFKLLLQWVPLQCYAAAQLCP